MRASKLYLISLLLLSAGDSLAGEMVYIDLGPGQQSPAANTLAIGGRISDLRDTSGSPTGARFELAEGGQAYAIRPAAASVERPRGYCYVGRQLLPI